MADITYLDSSRQADKTALPAGRLSTIHCLMIPLKGDILLLPNAAIAEVLTYKNITMMADSPPWLLGQLNWREQVVPVVLYEAAIGKETGVKLNKASRVAILNTLNGNDALPHIGLLTQGIPHLQVVHPQAVTPGEPSDNNGLISEHVLVNGIAAVIPDMDALEERVLSAISNHPN